MPERGSRVMAFTLTDLLVVIAILALLATTQLPALTRAKTPVNLSLCMNNVRRIGQATMLYKADNNDCFPYGNRCYGYGAGSNSVVDPYVWPMQLLHYLGGYQTNEQPAVYACPSEDGTAPGWAFQVHYQANRHLLGDIDKPAPAVTGALVRTPSILWMFIEKASRDYCSITSGGLENPVLLTWNYPPGSPGMRRHNGGMTAAAADGHAEWLRMPPYQPGRPAPCDLLELGTCVNSGYPSPPCLNPWDVNRAKMYLYPYNCPWVPLP